ncbi:uncharacterized protein LOC118748178 [Rhagoletis pomonella]|uniref:uncharacterized protein LOC118748178 n=1 Tax=Rhagoletis pomonella TaxID=28610 RepID=UPI001781E692|nr:uncharacterized protein LOC118748178 [Rhagoletis pomonella]
MTRTSHKKNRPFDFKLISLVEPHPVLYQRHWSGLSTFDCMKEKTRIWNEIAKDMEASADFCISRWNNLKNHFFRELRHCHQLCPKEGIIRGSTWPYLERMHFLQRTAPFNKPSKCEQTYRSVEHLESAEEEMSETQSNDNLQPNESYIEFEELSNDILDNEKSVVLPDPDQMIKERLENFNQMAELLKNIPSETKIQAERRIMAYLCKCQLRALVNKGIDDLSI